jgi:hypothetical protein
LFLFSALVFLVDLALIHLLALAVEIAIRTLIVLIMKCAGAMGNVREEILLVYVHVYHVEIIQHAVIENLLN